MQERNYCKFLYLTASISVPVHTRANFLSVLYFQVDPYTSNILPLQDLTGHAGPINCSPDRQPFPQPPLEAPVPPKFE